MSSRSERAILIMAMLVTALCADQLLAVEASLRPQAMVEMLEGMAGRTIRAQQQEQPAPTRFVAPSRQHVSLPALPRLVSLWRPHPSGTICANLRLPPPAAASSAVL